MSRTSRSTVPGIGYERGARTGASRSPRRAMKSLLAASCLLLAQRAGAQTLLHDFPGPFTNSSWGKSVACPGDVNLDGYGDVLVGTVFGGPSNYGGTVWLYSGLDGQLLLNWTGSPPQVEEIGWALSAAGDLDLDGRPDLLVGASGKAFVYSGANGSTLRTFTGPPNEFTYGRAVAALGDVDGDGRPDYAVGASLVSQTSTESGKVYVYSGATGALLHSVVGAGTKDWLGFALANAGDVDGDGRADLAAGAPQHTATPAQPGYVVLLSGLDGSEIRRIDGESHERWFGSSVASAGDVDLDGVPDLVVGAPGSTVGSPEVGTAALFSGATGQRLRTWNGQDAFGHFGISVASAGDVDRDSLPDVLVGAPGESPVGSGSGRLYCFSARDGGRILVFEGNSANDRLGWSCASGFVDPDAFPDLVVAAIEDAPGGRVRVWSPCPIPARRYCVTAPNSQTSGAVIGSTGSTSIAQDSLVLRATGAIPGGAGLFYCGNGAAQAVFGDGWRCVGGNTSRLGPVQAADGTGTAIRPVQLAQPPFASGPLHVLPGSLRYFQYWYRNPAGPGGTGFNLSDGLAVTFCP